MSAFLAGLSSLDKVFLFCAVVGGLVFLIRMAVQMIGADLHQGGDFGGDHGFSDIHADSDSSFHYLTIQGITIFIMMFGLQGICLHSGFGMGAAISIGGGLAAGAVSVWLIDKIMSSFTLLQSSGTMDIRNAIGQEGTVYLRIPAEGSGQVSVTVQGSLKVLDAISGKKEEIKTGENILVVDVINNRLVVERI